MEVLDAASNNPTNRFVEYKTGGHGAAMFAPHPDLPDQIVAWYEATLLGKGAMPETHDLSLQMLGMHGSEYANYAVHHCDLLIAVGARFDDRVTGHLASFAPNAVTAVEKAGSCPGRPGGHSWHSAMSSRRAARVAMLRQKVMAMTKVQKRGGVMTGEIRPPPLNGSRSRFAF